MLDVWLNYERGGHTYLAQDLPFAEATIVVVHPWTSRAATTYLITLDGAPLAVLGAGPPPGGSWPNATGLPGGLNHQLSRQDGRLARARALQLA